MREKFDKTGSICNAPKSGRMVSFTTQENEMLVSQAFTKIPQKSKQRAVIELGISRRSSNATFRFENISAKIALRVVGR